MNDDPIGSSLIVFALIVAMIIFWIVLGVALWPF